MNRPFTSPRLILLLTGALWLAVAATGHAAKIGDVMETNVTEQALRFFTFRDPSLRNALLGAILLGISGGLLGSFIVVRKLALVGDTLSHAVLPGVAIGFLWNMTKNPLAIFIGATLAGLLGTFVVSWITRTTRLKEDAALGMVLASFFAVGSCLVSMIQRLPTGQKSGIDKFLFGQAAALSGEDVVLMAITTTLSVLILAFFYKEFLVTSFDPAFAQSVGISSSIFHHLLMILLAFSVVVSLQAVGVVLVSAMLITPAASAYLLTDRMHRMLILAAIFGILAGATGAFLSFLGNNLPTGPLMVLGASIVFLGAFLFGPHHGLLPRMWRRRSQAERIKRENALKAVYQVFENANFTDEGISYEALALRRNESIPHTKESVKELERHQFVTTEFGKIYFTPSGYSKAVSLVRNHRLWELYLTNAAHYESDHVHEDAEKIEHVLGEEIVRQLEKQLHYPQTDPHGKPIPSDHAQPSPGNFGK